MCASCAGRPPLFGEKPILQRMYGRENLLHSVFRAADSFLLSQRKEICVKKAFCAAFPLTVPVLTGYLVLGMAYGLLMQDKGFGVWWIFVCSAAVFAGSMQFVGITLLTSTFQPVYALVMTLVINARHIFYGLSMLARYRGTGRWKPYLIFGLTDETFSVVCSVEPPDGVLPERFYFAVTLLDHLYWVAGSVLGALAGGLLTFNTEGMDFALTALFFVIFLNQWMEQKQHAPAIIGVTASLAALLLFGSANFLIPAMAAIVICLFAFRRRLDEGVKA